VRTVTVCGDAGPPTNDHRSRRESQRSNRSGRCWYRGRGRSESQPRCSAHSVRIEPTGVRPPSRPTRKLVTRLPTLPVAYRNECDDAVLGPHIDSANPAPTRQVLKPPGVMPGSAAPVKRGMRMRRGRRHPERLPSPPESDFVLNLGARSTGRSRRPPPRPRRQASPERAPA
jgi:hypothetical protein